MYLLSQSICVRAKILAHYCYCRNLLRISSFKNHSSTLLLSFTMMSIQLKGSFDQSNDHQQQPQDLVQLARELRRIKRRLLLEHAGVPLPASLVRSSSESTEVATNSSCESSPANSWTSSSPIRAAMMRSERHEEPLRSPGSSVHSME